MTALDVNANIISWIKSLNVWQQELAYRLLSNDYVSTEDIDIIISILSGDVEYEEKAFPIISAYGNNVAIQLKSIKDISNIEMLSPRNPLTFSPSGLTVIYGNNGVGKSGYTKILKRACGVPRAKELKKNIHTGDSSIGSCNIEYAINGVSNTINWLADSAQVDDLAGVDIYDADVGLTYIRDGNSITYTPRVIAFFSKFVEFHDIIKNILLERRNTLYCSLPKPPANIAVSTFITNYYNSDLIDLTKFVWGEEDDKKLKDISSRLKEEDPSKKARELRLQRSKLEILIKRLEEVTTLVSQSSYDKLTSLKQDLVKKEKAVSDAASIMKEQIKIDGVSSHSWRALWEAAKKYSVDEAYKGQSTSLDDKERCVLCQQILDEDAKSRLSQFESFISNDLSKDASEADRNYKELFNAIPSIFENEYKEDQWIAAGLDENWRAQLSSIWKSICDNGRIIKEGNGAIYNVLETITTAISALKQLCVNFEAQAVSFDKDALEIDINKISRECLELEARKWCVEQIKAIVAEKNRQDECLKYDNLIKQISTNAVTRKANEVADIIITDEYINRFKSELSLLGAKNVQVHIDKKGAKGIIRHFIKINNSEINPIEILSEGEIRIISLAAFIADVTGGNSCNPFIFDDPISSLDQIYEEKVVNRLVKLSQTRQVIVFTHRLSLLGQLYEADKDLMPVGIRKEHWGAGEIGDTPFFAKKPDKALKKLRDERLAQAKKTYEAHGMEEYNPLAKAICSEFRILLERIVETVFLADVVQRYRRALNTMGKIGNLAKITKVDCDLIDKFMTKYSCYEHSQPLELPVDVPVPNEIVVDINELTSWLDEFSKRSVE